MEPLLSDFNMLSHTTHYLRMVTKGTGATMATATGFVYEYADTFFLITAAHNVTRINPVDKQRISPFAAFPDQILTRVKVVIPDDPNSVGLSEELIDIDLYEDAESKIPTWYMHPIFGYEVDVIAIEWCKKNEVSKFFRLFPLNGCDFCPEFPIRVTDDVYVLGYPLDITGGYELPIYKRGSLASEPQVNIGGIPKILIDTASRHGMSGAPVIMQRHGFHQIRPGAPLSMKDKFGTISQFIGVYSGRIGADELSAQLGIVWKRNVITEILDGKVRGSTSFQNM